MILAATLLWPKRLLAVGTDSTGALAGRARRVRAATTRRC